MNAGLGNLTILKTWLLAVTMQSGTDYDVAIAAIGRGVAANFDRYCNRKFARIAGNVEIFPADRTKHVVQRYPIETIATLEIQQVLQDGWTVLPDLIINQQLDAGLLYFYGQQGWQRGLVRLTYTGGYFFEQLEPTDVGYPTALPVGATALPDDVQLAWQLQCEHIWTQRDKLGLAIAHDVHASNARVIPSLAQVSLLPMVAEMLQGYMRYQLS